MGDSGLIWSTKEIANWLQILGVDRGVDQTYMIYLSARKKYCDSIDKTRECYRRTLCSQGSAEIMQTIREFEVGLKLDRDPVPMESVVCYMSINPRDLVRAGRETHEELYQHLLKSRPEVFKMAVSRTHKLFLSKAQRYGKKDLLVIDLDVKSEYDRIRSKLRELEVTPLMVVETHGGYHITITNESLKANKEAAKYLYRELNNEMFSSVNSLGEPIKKHVADLHNNPFSAVPGCYQGGFKTRIIEIRGQYAP